MRLICTLEFVRGFSPRMWPKRCDAQKVDEVAVDNKLGAPSMLPSLRTHVVHETDELAATSKVLKVFAFSPMQIAQNCVIRHGCLSFGRFGRFGRLDTRAGRTQA